MIKNFLTFSRLTLFVALCISAIAAWYSVIGLTAIFAGAVIPIIVMGSILEVAKIVTTVWLHKYWNRAKFGIKTYLTVAVVVLACLTSMGIFGFLSKAHSDQSLVGGDVQSKIAIYDEKLKTAKENIETDRKQLKQMDEAVDQVMARSTTEDGAAKSNAIRKAQARDRSALAKNIEANQKLIATLNEEAAPIRAEVRKVEAEVGPIKYIAALIYGDNPDANLLERAVRWVIIIIVSVFDPLAIMLILAANNSLKWEEEDAKEEDTKIKMVPIISTLDEVKLDDVQSAETKSDDESIDDFPPIVDIQQKIATEEIKINEELAESSEPQIKDMSLKSPYNSTTYTMSSYEIKLPEQQTVIHAKQAEEQGEIELPKFSEEHVSEDVNTDNDSSVPAVNYVNYHGKQYSVDALKEIRPDLVKTLSKNDIMFGMQFPEVAKIGDIYTRVDMLPHVTYKFNGARWIKIDRTTNFSYLQNIAYLQFLISKLESGEYDAEMLTEAEKEEISEYLNRTA